MLDDLLLLLGVLIFLQILLRSFLGRVYVMSRV